MFCPRRSLTGMGTAPGSVDSLPRANAKSGSEPLSWEFEGGHGPCGGLKVSDAIDHPREARAREFIFPVRPAAHCRPVRLVSGEAGSGRVGRPAAGPVLGARS